MDYMDLYAVYVPTPINLKDTLATTPSSNEHLHGRAEVMTTPHKNEECEGYSPSKPEMWTVKRKAKPEESSNTVGVGAKITTLAALRALPLPGRPSPSTVKEQNLKTSHNHLHFPTMSQQNQDEQGSTSHSTTGNAHQETWNTAQNPPVIQQVFQDTDRFDTHYTATMDFPESENVENHDPNRVELSAMIEMISQLKKNGLMSSDNSSAHSHTNTPPSSCEFSHASAILAARQMMKEQTSTNTYSCESATEEYPMNAYEAKFETSEMMAQERLQVSRNSQRWTQAGWKIDEPCIYFASRPDGCFRGDNCRFIHDEAMRQRKNQSPLGNYHHYDTPEQRRHVDFGLHGTNRDSRDYQVGSNLLNNEINDGTSKFRGGRYNKRRHENGASPGGRPFNKNGGDNGGYRSYHGRQQQQYYDHRNSGCHLNENQFNGSICKTTEPSRKRARTFQVD